MLDLNAESAELYLNGAVGNYFDDGFDEKDFRGALQLLGGRDVKITLRSDGGDVFSGLSIVNQIRSYEGNVTIVVDSLAASIASVIAVAADELYIYDGSMLMIHNPWTVAMGDASEFRGVADLLDKIAGEIANVYASKGNQSADGFLKLMEKDTYLTAAQAQEMGLVDGIIYPKEKRTPAAERSALVSASVFPRAIAAKHRLREMRTRCR